MSPARPVAKSTAAELLRAETLLLDPSVRRDQRRVAALLADDFFEFGASGRVWTRNDILHLLATEPYTPPILEDFACHRLPGDAFLVTYRTVRENAATGHRETALRSSIWVRQAGRWRVRFHQGTRVE